jgi:hypothetical protein
MELFKFIEDTENVYSVSNYGRIRNNTTDYILKPFITERGYFQVAIQFSSRPKRITIDVHRLVARHFIENPLCKPYVNHIDGNKLNNYSTNLEWVTPKENNNHAVKLGLIKSGEGSYLAKLSEKDVLTIIDLLREGQRNIDIARLYGVEHNTIDDIRCNRTWRYIERDPIPGNGPKKKLVEEDIFTIREMFLKGFSNRKIGGIFGVAPATIDQIRKGNTWKGVGIK